MSVPWKVGWRDKTNWTWISSSQGTISTMANSPGMEWKGVPHPCSTGIYSCPLSIKRINGGVSKLFSLQMTVMTPNHHVLFLIERLTFSFKSGFKLTHGTSTLVWWEPGHLACSWPLSLNSSPQFSVLLTNCKKAKTMIFSATRNFVFQHFCAESEFKIFSWFWMWKEYLVGRC